MAESAAPIFTKLRVVSPRRSTAQTVSWAPTANSASSRRSEYGRAAGFIGASVKECTRMVRAASGRVNLAVSDHAREEIITSENRH